MFRLHADLVDGDLRLAKGSVIMGYLARRHGAAPTDLPGWGAPTPSPSVPRICAAGTSPFLAKARRPNKRRLWPATGRPAGCRPGGLLKLKRQRLSHRQHVLARRHRGVGRPGCGAKRREGATAGRVPLHHHRPASASRAALALSTDRLNLELKRRQMVGDVHNVQAAEGLFAQAPKMKWSCIGPVTFKAVRAANSAVCRRETPWSRNRQRSRHQSPPGIAHPSRR